MAQDNSLPSYQTRAYRDQNTPLGSLSNHHSDRLRYSTTNLSDVLSEPVPPSPSLILHKVSHS